MLATVSSRATGSRSLSLTTMAALLTLGGDAAAISATMKRGILRLLGPRSGEPSADVERAIDMFVSAVPVVAAVGAMMTLTINLWLAAKITVTSGRLNRPWPDIRSTALPPMTLVALCVAAAFCFTGGLLAMLAQVTASALLMGYAFTGFAVLHTLTLRDGMLSRMAFALRRAPDRKRASRPDPRARLFAADCLERRPDFTIGRWLAKVPLKEPAESAHLAECLRAARLPE